MKALTIWQPWARLVILRIKPFEFRGWNFADRPQMSWLVGERIAIHAGKRPVRRDELADLLLRVKGPAAWTTALRRDEAIELLEKVHASPSMLPVASVLGTAVLGRPVIGTAVVEEFGGPPNDSDRDEHANWAWPLTDVERFDFPRPASGAQGFWNWRDET